MIHHDDPDDEAAVDLSALIPSSAALDDAFAKGVMSRIRDRRDQAGIDPLIGLMELSPSVLAAAAILIVMVLWRAEVPPHRPANVAEAVGVPSAFLSAAPSRIGLP